MAWYNNRNSLRQGQRAWIYGLIPSLRSVYNLQVAPFFFIAIKPQEIITRTHLGSNP